VEKLGKKCFSVTKWLKQTWNCFSQFFSFVVSIWTEVTDAYNDSASPKVELEKVNDDEGQLTTKLTCLYPFSHIIHCHNHQNWSSLPFTDSFLDWEGHRWVLIQHSNSHTLSPDHGTAHAIGPDSGILGFWVGSTLDYKL